MGKFNQEDRGNKGGRPPMRGGKPGGFNKGGGGRGPPRGPKVYVIPHRLPGIYIAKQQKDALVTKNLVPG